MREIELHFPHECGRGGWAEMGAGRQDENADPIDLIADLGIPACIRPMPVWRDCLGEMCWNFRRDLRC